MHSISMNTIPCFLLILLLPVVVWGSIVVEELPVTMDAAHQVDGAISGDRISNTNRAAGQSLLDSSNAFGADGWRQQLHVNGRKYDSSPIEPAASTGRENNSLISLLSPHSIHPGARNITLKKNSNILSGFHSECRDMDSPIVFTGELSRWSRGSNLSLREKDTMLKVVAGIHILPARNGPESSRI